MNINEFFFNSEVYRQELNINLIASENYSSKNVLFHQSSCFTNKYSEGYYKNRYYGGCKYVDEIEFLAIERVKRLFNVKHANVQPHSGSQANFAVLNSLCSFGDIILCMKLDHGGHLSHGAKINCSGKIYYPIYYGVNHISGCIDYDEVKRMALKYKPKVIIAGGSAYSRIINWSIFKNIANNVNAYLVADISHLAGLIIAGFYPSPFKFADIVTTTTHKTLRGPRGGLILTNNEELKKKINFSIFPGSQGGSLVNVIAAKSVSFKEAMSYDFILYQKKILDNAKYFANRMMYHGFMVSSGGTDTHLFLINLKNKGVTGKYFEYFCEKVNIIFNKNCISNDFCSSSIASGIRIGTSSITSRGFKETEILYLSNWMAKIINFSNSFNDKKILYKIKSDVLNLCKSFPIYIF
ncbi:MAG TPA: serine hydroxymethyltransferase [Candidatus Azosocius sp. HAIN]